MWACTGLQAATDKDWGASTRSSSPQLALPSSACISSDGEGNLWSPVLSWSSGANVLAVAESTKGAGAISGVSAPDLEANICPNGHAPNALETGYNDVVFGSFDNETSESGEEGTELASALSRTKSTDAGGMVFVGCKVSVAVL